MRGKKIIDFVLLKPAFTQKNFTAVLIVAGLMGGYMLLTGQNSMSIPKFDNVGEFGTVGDVGQPATMNKEKAEEILGVATTSDREKRLENVAAANPLTGADGRKDIEPVNKDLGYNFDQQKRKEESDLQKYEHRKKDSLDDLAERLNLKK